MSPRVCPPALCQVPGCGKPWNDPVHTGDLETEMAHLEFKWALEDVTSAQAALARAVKFARANGATWTQVGRALGVSRQAALKRFGG